LLLEFDSNDEKTKVHKEPNMIAFGNSDTQLEYNEPDYNDSGYDSTTT
jgi:hypothetical protein